MKKKCVICGTEFESPYPHKVTCSPECSKAHHNRRSTALKKEKHDNPTQNSDNPPIKCQHCGKEFIKWRGNQKFCSAQCRDNHEKANRPKAQPKPPKVCAQCGQEFIPTNNNQKYCSVVCCEAHWHRSAVEKTLTCKTCGKKFTDVYNAKYCSKKCRDEAIKKEQAKQAMAKATGEKVKTLSDWTREARECNMDYGQYRAQIEVFGKTFEELKATADARAMPLHAHAGKSSKNTCDSGYGIKVG